MYGSRFGTVVKFPHKLNAHDTTDVDTSQGVRCTLLTVQWTTHIHITHCIKFQITYSEIHIFFTKYSISFRSFVRSKLKWIKRNKLWMPMKTVQPHSVNVSISPHAEIRNDDCARHVSAISTIKKCDQNLYKRPNIVGASVCCSGHAPLIFNIIHCDGKENVLSLSFGNGLNIFVIRFLFLIIWIVHNFSRKKFTIIFHTQISLIYWVDYFRVSFLFFPKLKITATFVLKIWEC